MVPPLLLLIFSNSGETGFNRGRRADVRESAAAVVLVDPVARIVPVPLMDAITAFVVGAFAGAPRVMLPLLLLGDEAPSLLPSKSRFSWVNDMTRLVKVGLRLGFWCQQECICLPNCRGILSGVASR